MKKRWSRPPTVVCRQVAVPAARVFTILSDAWLIPVWLVGAAHIRDVDAGWPAVGAQLHHSIGAWPLLISDTTQVVEVEPQRRLRLHARMWPLGEAVVELRLESRGTGCDIVMAEAPAGGPTLWLDNPLQRLYLRRRNVESLARMASLVERRRG